MKKFNTFKIVQLILLIILTAVSLYMLMQPEVKQYIFRLYPCHHTFYHCMGSVISHFCVSFN